MTLYRSDVARTPSEQSPFAMPTRYNKGALPSLVILAALVMFHLPYCTSYFITDDPVCLYCSHHSSLSLFFDRASYSCFSNVHFTPLLPLSFKPDWWLFTLNPLGPHLHNLLAALVAVFLSYQALIRTALSPLLAALLVALWAFSPPLTLVTAMMTTRHWIWGLCSALLAVFFFLRWEQERKNRILLLALFFHLLAALWKEGYLTLPAVIFLAASGPIPEKIRKVLPFAAVSVLYLGWRIFMLRGFGGYPWVDLSVSAALSHLLWSPFVLSRIFFAVPWLLPGVLLLLGRDLGKFLLLWIAVASPVSPILPTDYPSDFDMRLFFPLSWVALWGIAQALQRLPAQGKVIGVYGLCALSLAVNLPRATAILSALSQGGEEGKQVVRFLQEVSCPKVYLVGTAAPQWYLSSMLKIHKELLQAPMAEGVALSPTGSLMSHGLLTIDTPENPCGVFRYNNGTFTPAVGETAQAVERFLRERKGPVPVLHGSGADHRLMLTWSEVEGSADYLLYYGDESGVYGDALPLKKSPFVFPNFPSRTYYFTIAARYPDGTIGVPSAEVRVTIP